MTPKQIKKLQEKLDKAYEKIDAYFEPIYKKANTEERIKIRGVQRIIHEIVEIELQLEAECYK